MNTDQRLKAAEQKLAAVTAAKSDAAAQLEQALASLKSESTDKARKAVVLAEDALRLADTELGWAREALQAAQAEYAEGEHAARLAAYAQAHSSCSVGAFQSQVGDVLQQLVTARARVADLEAKADQLCAKFQREQEVLVSTALELGAPAPRLVNFGQVRKAEEAIAANQPASEVMGSILSRPLPNGLGAEDALNCARRGAIDEAAHLVNQIGDVVQRQAHAAKAFSEGDVDKGHILEGLARGYDDTRTQLASLGLEHIADRIRQHGTATRIVAAGVEKVGRLVTLLRGRDSLKVKGSSEQERAIARKRIENESRQQLRAMGLDDVAELARPEASLGSPAPGASASF